MKSIVSIILVLAMAISTGACSINRPSSNELENKTAETQTTMTEPNTEEAAQPVISSSDIEVKPTSEAIPTDQLKEEIAENTPKCTIAGGGYVVDLMKAEIAKDGLGNDCIALRFKFTNNNPQEMALVYIAMETVKQGGRTLSIEGMVTNPNDPSQMGLCQWVSNGQSVDVSYIYPYYSDEDIDFSLTLVKDLNSITPIASGNCTISIEK